VQLLRVGAVATLSGQELWNFYKLNTGRNFMPWRERAKQLWEEKPPYPYWQNISKQINSEYCTNVTSECVRSAIRRSGQYESLRAGAKSLIESPVHSQRKSLKTRPESAILHITDLHFGKETESFNLDALEKRLNNMTKSVCSIGKILKRTYDIDKLYVFDTGDAIDGNMIYKTHPHHVDKRAAYGRAQVKAAVNILSEPLEELVNVFGLVEYHKVPGNHGRNSLFDHEKNNWDLIMADMMTERHARHPRLKIHTHNNFYGHVDVQGHGCVLYHGAGIKMYQSIPWYGITQRVTRWAQTMPKPFKYAFMGHFHIRDNLTWCNKEIFLSGSPVTDDEWVLEEMGMGSMPEFWFLGMHPERGVTWRYAIDLL
jgi:hypothetical protein